MRRRQLYLEVLLLNFAFVEFVKVVRWISLGCYMDLSKLISESLPRLSQCVTQERGAVDMRRRQLYLEVLWQLIWETGGRGSAILPQMIK